MRTRMGEVWIVRAWWLKGDRCLVKVRETYESGAAIVLPLEGNPHARRIEVGDFIERVGGHAAETISG